MPTSHIMSTVLGINEESVNLAVDCKLKLPIITSGTFFPMISGQPFKKCLLSCYVISIIHIEFAPVIRLLHIYPLI